MINAEVTKSGTENTLSVIRRFTRRVQGAGLVRTVRGSRYFQRNPSKSVKKKQAIKRITRQADYRQKVKEGKIIEAPARRQSHTREAAAPARLGEATPIAR